MQELVMKCEVCQEALEEYLDGELSERESREIVAHVAVCPSCAAESAALSAEQELFSRYDRELAVPPLMWKQIFERTAAPAITPVSNNGFSFGARIGAFFRLPSLGFSFAVATVLVVFALVIYATFLKTQKQKPIIAQAAPTAAMIKEQPGPLAESLTGTSSEPQPQKVAVKNLRYVHRKVVE